MVTGWQPMKINTFHHYASQDIFTIFSENKVVNVDLTKESDEGRRESKSLLLQTLKQIGAGRM
jgi:hypothetical protein